MLLLSAAIPDKGLSNQFNYLRLLFYVVAPEEQSGLESIANED